MNPARAQTNKRPRKLRQILTVVGTAVALVLVSGTANVALERTERSSIVPYGQRVQTSHGALNVYRAASNDGSKPVMILLSGLGTTAPAIDFAPLIRELADYDVVVVEGLGYGYSDMEAVPRTVENISQELHEALAGARIKGPYILAGHSIAGLYTLAYANTYPDELAAIVEIDPTIAALHGGREGNSSAAAPGINWGRLLAATGIVRWATTLVPSLAVPEADVYTAEEKERIRIMTNWDYDNPALVDETARIGENIAKVKPLQYPKDLPVLTFLDSGDHTQTDTAPYEARLSHVRHHQITLLPGSHYLHRTQSPAMTETINNFLNRAHS